MMKKLLLLFIVAFLSTTYVNAQSLSLSWDGQALPDTVSVFAHPDSTNTIEFHALVTNNTDNIIALRLARVNLDVLDGTINSFCFANTCYSPFMDTTPDLPDSYLIIPAGAISTEEQGLKAEYSEYFDAYGTSLVKYSFFNRANPAEYVDVVVKYWSSPTAIDETLANSIKLSNVYPNPAHSTVNLDYSFDVNVDAATVKIVNLLGSVVKEVEMNQNANKLSIDVSNLNAGVYFYSVIVNNEIFQTKKLVIR